MSSGGGWFDDVGVAQPGTPSSDLNPEVNVATEAERAEIGRTVRRFLSQEASLSHAREVGQGPQNYDPRIWTRLNSELGLSSIHIPEAYGGQGFDHRELSVVMHETGRVLLPSPLLSSSVLAANVVQQGATEQEKMDLLPSMASGERTATVAVAERDAGWDLTRFSTEVRRKGGRFVLSGSKVAVLDDSAELLLVVARSLEGDPSQPLTVVLVEPQAQGVKRRPTPPLDPTRPLCAVEFRETPARPIGDLATSWPLAVREAIAYSIIALASEMTGGARRCIEMAVEHARSRKQFGRAIGSFQAIKHLCADMLVEVELADALVKEALETKHRRQGSLSVMASAAKLQASRAYLYAAHEGLHVHGGLGFTWEHDAHMFVRRAKASDLMFGGRDHHRNVLLSEVGRWGQLAAGGAADEVG